MAALGAPRPGGRRPGVRRPDVRGTVVKEAVGLGRRRIVRDGGLPKPGRLLTCRTMDMLIALYGLPALRRPPADIEVRKPLAPEHDLVAAWVARHFTAGWASEARAALANRPVTLFIATRADPAELLGFCCHDATALGFVGPVGVLDSARRSGLGAALLHACLHDMRAAGYGSSSSPAWQVPCRLPTRSPAFTGACCAEGLRGCGQRRNGRRGKTH